MPHIGRNTVPEAWINLHFSVGVLILTLMVVRLVARLTLGVPHLPADIPGWQRIAAQASHLALYVLLAVIPLLGWANASARGFTISLFGLLPLPALVETGNAFGRAVGDVHANLAIVLIVLVGLHVLAALYHQLVRRDHIFRRIWFG